MVLVDMVANCNLGARVITIDTGRLPDESYQMIDTIKSRYGIGVERILPDQGEVDRMVATHGRDLFRDEVALRKLCCQVRKVRPMERALEGLDAYAVGLRRTQSESRENLEQAVKVDGKWKLSPLAYWSSSDVEDYIERHRVPIHPLYAKGYPSIGCEPCTRAVYPGENERSGRWWWEQESDKECGLHFSPEGRMERKLDVLLRELVGTNA
jgi:phosphoadenylyl-sulfate reductase (thioredoxin)